LPDTIALIGLPVSFHSSYLSGSARAPDAIRAALRCESTNMWTESGIDLGCGSILADAGDRAITASGFREEIDAEVARLLKSRFRPVCLGGDHSISYPILRAIHREHGAVQLLQLDAHPDLYDNFENNPYSHASPFARIMEEGLAARLVQAGIRAANRHQRAQAERFSVEMFEMRDWRGAPEFRFTGPLYISLDLDVLDPAFAPGVSHPEPGGLSTRQIIEILQSIGAPIVGADIVELNPDRDPLGITAMAGAKLLKEIAARMIENG